MLLLYGPKKQKLNKIKISSVNRLSFFCSFTSFTGTAPKQQLTQNHSKEKQKLNFCHRLKRPMVDIAQSVRALDCESKCTGSNPVIHPK